MNRGKVSVVWAWRGKVVHLVQGRYCCAIGPPGGPPGGIPGGPPCGPPGGPPGGQGGPPDGPPGSPPDHDFPPLIWLQTFSQIFNFVSCYTFYYLGKFNVFSFPEFSALVLMVC